METLRIERVVDGLTYISFVGTAEALAEMVRDWIVDDLYSIPVENLSICGQDQEFTESLEMYDRLCKQWINDREYGPFIYKLTYIDGEGYVNGLLEKMMPWVVE